MHQLYTYSLIRSLYEAGSDFIDSFWPLVVKTLPADASAVALQPLQDAIDAKFAVRIPQHSLVIILTRATRRGYIVRASNRVSLTEKGRSYLADLESEREVERRINELLDDARSFINRQLETALSAEEVRELLTSFVDQNLDLLEHYLSSDGPAPEPTQKEPASAQDAALAEFFRTVEQRRPAVFKTLQDVVCGSILSAIVTLKDFGESPKRFERTIVHFDSNFVLGLLNLRYEEENRPPQELFELMKSEGAFEFFVFDFTVHEITALLHNYEREQYLYTPRVKVGSIFGSLRSKGWTVANVVEFIAGVDGQLRERGIAISPTKVNLKSFEPSVPESRAALSRYKPGQPAREQNHDLAAIEQTKAFRKRSATHIEKCQAIFLTSDLKLAEYNFVEDHKERGTISEVIPDRLLTNLLWLKNPKLNPAISLTSLIALHSRQLFIDQTVWKRFYSTIQGLRNDGSLDEKDASVLLYDRHIHEVLREIDPEDEERMRTEIERLTQEVASDPERPSSAEVAVVSEPAETARLMEELQALRADVTKIRSDGERRILRTVELFKKRKELEAESETDLLFGIAIATLVAASLALSLFLLRPLIARWPTMEPVAWLLAILTPTLLALLGIRFNPGHWRRLLRTRIFNWRHQAKLAAVRDFEANFVIDLPVEEEEGSR